MVDVYVCVHACMRAYVRVCVCDDHGPGLLQSAHTLLPVEVLQLNLYLEL